MTTAATCVQDQPVHRRRVRRRRRGRHRRGAQPARRLAAGRRGRGPGRRRRPRGRGRAAGVPGVGGDRGRRARPRPLLRLADAIEAHADELARLESTDTGHPLKDTRCSTCPAPRRPTATSAAWPTSSRGGRPGRRRASSTTSARADRRGRPDRAVELPAHVLQLEARPGPGRRQHGGDEAVRADPLSTLRLSPS